MIIGKSGEKIKVIGRESRIDMEFLFDRKVFLNYGLKSNLDGLMMREL